MDSGGRGGVRATGEVCILEEVRSKDVNHHGSKVGGDGKNLESKEGMDLWERGDWGMREMMSAACHC